MLVLLFSSMSFFVANASCLVDSRNAAAQSGLNSLTAGYSGLPGQKVGVIKQLKALKLAKKAWRQQQEGEKAGKKARIALWLFVGAMVVGRLATLVPWLTWVVIGAWLASLVLCIWVLIGKENPRSRKIAKVLLIISGAMLLLALLLLVLLEAIFGPL